MGKSRQVLVAPGLCHLQVAELQMLTITYPTGAQALLLRGAAQLLLHEPWILANS